MSRKTFTITCNMEERWADYFCSFLTEMEKNGRVGHSEMLGFYSDGDGDFRPLFRFDTDFDLKNPRESKKYDGLKSYDAG